MEAKKIKNLFANRDKNESGYALVLTLGIVILTIGILSSMTLLTVKDVKSSTKNRGVLEARISGESALDSLYAAANANGSKDILTALSTFKTFGGSLIVDTTNPVTTSPGGGVTQTTFPWRGFFGIDPNGSIVSCPVGNTTPCFKLRLIKVVTKPDYTDVVSGSATNDITAAREEYIVDIVTRTRCDRNTTNNCSYSRIQQNMSLRRYIEYVSISVKENVAPIVLAGSPLNGTPAINSTYSVYNYYAGQDSVQGNIHTNDEIIRSCNAFNSAAWITSKGKPGNPAGQSTTGIYTGSTLCGAGPGISVKKATRTPLALPTRDADPTAEGLKQIAQNDSPTKYVVSGDVVFDSNGTFKVNGAPSTGTPMPPSGVLFLSAASSISGEIKGKITIASAAGADITIKANLTYAGGRTSNNLLGVYSGGNIKIACRNSTPTGQCQSITIDGFLKSNTNELDTVNRGTIFNPDWDRTATGGNPPEINLFGGMESYYRGTFGTIDSTDDKVKTGFKKTFTFDPRLVYEQPPFMLRDGTVPFIRNAVKDVPCSTFCNN